MHMELERRSFVDCLIASYEWIKSSQIVSLYIQSNLQRRLLYVALEVCKSNGLCGVSSLHTSCLFSLSPSALITAAAFQGIQ